ncbi:hypothetical protein PFISCL1PPCAC_25078, partial [Pristionchus fissidentatus]
MHKSRSTTPPRRAARAAAAAPAASAVRVAATRDRPTVSLPPVRREKEKEKERPKVDIFQQAESVLQLQQQPEAPKIDKKMAELFVRVFAGHFTSIPKPLSKLVRVFTSSTFTDTTVERNALMEDVYPRLKEHCREMHGLDFQVVDMRWGVRDEATDDHMTTKLCINEIGNCQRLSVGPNFVVFLCQKYGYRPIPSEILCTELEMLKRTLKEENEDTTVLETWYIEDANAVPSHFVLQPISSILRIPKLQEQDAATWWETEEKMQQLLRKAARICYEKGFLSHEAQHNYFMSVTEREVIHGILKAKNVDEHCICYVRQTHQQHRCVANSNRKQVNTEAQKLLANLRDERVPAKVSADNIRRSTVEWAGRDGIDVQYHAEYIRQFCSDFYKRITRMVDAAMAKHAQQRDPLFSEVLQHLDNVRNVSAAFFGRMEQLEIAEQYMLSTSNLPIILQGENGCGKTALLAKIACSIRGWLGDTCDPVIVLRFLGTSPDSSTIAPLLTSVCDQIMIFDSLDLLSKIDGAHELLWFPPTLPSSVKLFCSITPGASNISGTMRRLVEEDEQYVEVPSLGMDLALDVIREWLKSSARTISHRQWELVTKALNKCTLPLFVKLIYATVARWKSYSRPQETILFQSVQESIHALLQRTEGQHGKLLVSHALSYITAARSGISDSEVEDLISLDDKVLDDIYQYHLPPVRRIPPLLWSRIRADLPGYLSERSADGVIVLNWYHEQFRQATVERYFKNLNHLETCHSSIAEYFLGIWGGVPKPYQYTEMQKQRFGVAENEGLADRKVPKQPNVFLGKDGKPIRFNTRKLNELPYHLLRAGRTEELLNLCLFNYDFLQAKVSSFPLQAVIGDYDDAITNLNDVDVRRQLNLVADALRLSASLLSRHPTMLPFELIGRLLPLVPNNSHLAKLLIECDLEGSKTSAFLPAHHCFHSPGGPLKFSLEEHMFAVFGMQLTSDKKMLVTTSNQIIVWDVSTGDLARVVNPNIDGVFFGLSLSPDDKYAAAYTNNNQIIVISLITGEYISIEPEIMVNQMEVENVEWTLGNQVLIWSRTHFFIFALDGKLVHTLTIDQIGGGKKLLHAFYCGPNRNRFVTWSGERDDWDLTMVGNEPMGEGHLSFLHATFCITVQLIKCEVLWTCLAVVFVLFLFGTIFFFNRFMQHELTEYAV